MQRGPEESREALSQPSGGELTACRRCAREFPYYFVECPDCHAVVPLKTPQVVGRLAACALFIFAGAATIWWGITKLPGERKYWAVGSGALIACVALLGCASVIYRQLKSRQ